MTKEARVNRILDDKAYMERAVQAVAPKILRAIASQEERERQKRAALRVKALIREIASRRELIEKFKTFSGSDNIPEADLLMLKVYGCSSFQELVDELEKQNDAFFQVICRLSAWLRTGLRDKTEDWLIGNISTKEILAAMPGRA